jgi:hypothetical protein
MFFRGNKGKNRQIQCWSARLCGIMVLVLLYFPYSQGIRAAREGYSEIIPLLILWGIAALSVIASFKWEKTGGAVTAIAGLASCIYLFAKYRGEDLMLTLIVTFLLLMTGIMFLQCWQRKKLAGE